MPAKRKYTLSKESSFSGDSPYSKRPRRSVLNQSELAQSIFDVLKDFEDENGHLIADTFMKLPSKRQNQDYYDQIVDPVDLTKIGQRIRMDEYRDIEILTADIQLMIGNAKKYYEEDSQEFTDACNLWEIYLNTKSRILEEAKAAEASRPRFGRKDSEIAGDDLKELFESLVTETDSEERVIAEMFMQLPDESNTQYYKVIKEPIDFGIISDRIEEGYYSSFVEFEKDIKLLVKNAKVFNEPSSQIYEDAVTICQLLKEKVHDFTKRKPPDVIGVKHSARIKHRRSWGRTPTKSLDKSGSKDEKGKQDPLIPDPADTDYQALLYNEVVNYRNPHGHTISDPFLRLPNKRVYPFYYEEIENPISLKIVKRKILTRKYETCEDLGNDLNLLFDNAMHFNISSSQIHKDAATLKKMLETRLPEYLAKEEEFADEEDDNSESDQDVDDASTSIKTENAASSASDTVDGKTKKRYRKRKSKSLRDLLQDRLRLLYDTVHEAKNITGREMILLFLEKPSRKDYPDYYKLVLEPIDMKIIDKKIRQDKYSNPEDMLEDFSLMFNNARHYNEPGSEVYNDANALEKLLLDKHTELGPLPELEDASDSGFPSFRSTKKFTDLKLSQLFSRVRDHVDPSKRMICDIFMHLPTKQELPDYYKVIKKPMEMDRIQQKMQNGSYLKLEEMLQDLLLMFENACTYNEPGSVIYKDALILQKVAVENFYELEPANLPTPPDQMVHDLISSLFVSVLGHQDENGRCYSDSLTSQSSVKSGPEQESQSEPAQLTNVKASNPETKLTLEIVRKNLRNRRYRRLDVFQEQMFEVFEEARNVNRTDSEVYEDVVEMQKFFIRIRNELCKNGEILMSPALAFNVKHLEAELDLERKEKLPLETKEDEEIKEEGKELREKMQMSEQAEEMSVQGTTYNVGDFVYVENPDSLQQPHIVCIEKLYTDERSERRLYGSWFLRPEATFHFPSKKFLLKEVFKSDYYNTVPVSLIRGRCFVMLGRDYFKMKPEGFNDADVYVCESRYSSKTKSFKRIKFLQLPPNNVELSARETPLPVIRMPSCYSDSKPVESGMNQDKGNLIMMQGIDPSWSTDPIDKDRENIKTDTQNPHSEATYYSQYLARNMWIKLGDCVYVQQGPNAPVKISRVERLWTDAHNNVWLHGPWFIRPHDLEHEPTKMFYRNELVLSAIEDTYPISEVMGKCLVMAFRDYCECRPSQLLEKDIFHYESKYSEQDKVIKKIKVKRYTPSFKVVDDEYFYYRKQITVELVLSPLLIGLVKDELLSRENELKLEAAQQSHPPRIAQVPGGPHYPQAVNNAQVYPQVMAPQTGYIQQAHIIPQYQAQYHGYQASPAPGAHPSQPGVPQHYITQQFQASGSYPVSHPQLQAYQNSPQPYSSSPHPNIMTPSPGIFQSPENSRPSSTHPEAAPTPPPKKKGRGGHSTGYILFASHCHPKVRSENPDMAFGEISKIVGEEWRNLEEDKKREYEEKAREHTAKLEAEGKLFKKKKKKKENDEISLTGQPVTPHGTPSVAGHYAAAYQPGQFQQGIPQQRMTGTPLPSGVQPYPGSASPMTSYAQTPAGPGYPGQQPQQVPSQLPTEAQKHRLKRGALFVKPPPKAQRVMHSEAYLRYIEGLEKGSKTVSSWSKSLKVKEVDVHLSREDEAKLPMHWLGNGRGQHQSVKSALWALRDYMLKDALTIKQNLA